MRELRRKRLDTNLAIIEVQGDTSLEACAEVIRAAFATVAEARGLTPASAPTHSAWLGADWLRQAGARGVRLFAAVEGRAPIAFAALEPGRQPGVFYLEKLAVLPARRHLGIGRRLVEHVAAAARAAGGSVLSIGIIDDEPILKRWYEGLGFVVTGTKRFEHLPFTVCFLERRLGA